jgi:hypothetical protein
MRRFGIAIGSVLLLLNAAPVRAQSLWAQNWQDYSPSERYEALRNYRRHQKLPRDEQRAVEQQYQRWQGLPEGERDRIRRNYDRYRELPQTERDQFERKYRAWKRGRDQQ